MRSHQDQFRVRELDTTWSEDNSDLIPEESTLSPTPEAKNEREELDTSASSQLHPPKTVSCQHYSTQARGPTDRFEDSMYALFCKERGDVVTNYRHCISLHWRRKRGGPGGRSPPKPGSQGAGPPLKICVRSCAFATHVPFPVSCALNSLLVIKHILVHNTMLT